MLSNKNKITNEIKNIIISEIMENSIECENDIESILKYVAATISDNQFIEEMKLSLRIRNTTINEGKRILRERRK